MFNYEIREITPFEDGAGNIQRLHVVAVIVDDDPNRPDEAVEFSIWASLLEQLPEGEGYAAGLTALIEQKLQQFHDELGVQHANRADANLQPLKGVKLNPQDMREMLGGEAEGRLSALSDQE